MINALRSHPVIRNLWGNKKKKGQILMLNSEFYIRSVQSNLNVTQGLNATLNVFSANIQTRVMGKNESKLNFDTVNPYS